MMISGNGSTSAEVHQREMPALDMLLELLGRRWSIAKIVAGFFVVGLILGLVLPRRYTATATVMPPQQAPSGISVLANQLLSAGGGSGSLAALAGGGGLGLRNPNDIYIGILQSRIIADNLIHKYDLQNIYKAKDMTETRKKLKSYTVIDSEKSGVLSVAVTDKDKQRSAAMANSYIDELRTLTNSLSETEANRRLEFYSKRLEESKDALDTAQKNLQVVEQNKSVFQPEVQGRAIVEQIAELQREISAKELQLQMLKNYSTDNNPQVKVVSAGLGSLRGQLSQLQHESFGKDAAKTASGSLPDAGLAYYSAEHEVRYKQTMFDLLSRQYDAAMLDISRDATVIQVLEPAVVPDRKSSPHVGIIVAIFTFAGLIFGCGWAILLWKTETLRASAPYQERLFKFRTVFGRKQSGVAGH